MSYETIEVDAMLLGWSETHNGGEKLTLQLQPGQIEPFKLKTVAKGKTAGQMFKVVFVEVDGNGEPVAPTGGIMANDVGRAALDKPSKRGGKFPNGLCGLAIRWCEEPQFSVWMVDKFPRETVLEVSEVQRPIPEFAAAMIKRICGVASRKELDIDDDAKQIFEVQIHGPYAHYRKEIGLD